MVVNPATEWHNGAFSDLSIILTHAGSPLPQALGWSGPCATNQRLSNEGSVTLNGYSGELTSECRGTTWAASNDHL
jgi:hypothetical protein